MNVYSEVQNIIYKLAKPLASYLSQYLPRLGIDWWYTCVISKLQPHQVQAATENDLYSLDTLALLRVFDRNWYDLGKYVKLDFLLKNIINETITIRNECAHISANRTISDDNLVRYLDTLRRLCEAIGADFSLIDCIYQINGELNDEIYDIPKIVVPNPNLSVVPDPEKEAEFSSVLSVGTLIRLKAKPEQIASIMEVSLTGPEPKYTVFVDKKKKFWYHSQIEVVPVSDDNQTVSLSEFNAYITATQLQNPNSQALFCLNSAKIDIIPHQFRPVLKFIKADRPRLLIADGVGVGKTIEAGLILKELEARNDIESVLVICPKPLVSEEKWEEEMKVKFGELFTPLDSKHFRQAIREADMNSGWEMARYGKIIVPYSLFTEDKLTKSKRDIGLFDLEDPPKFDLVIVDEAHHIRNSSTWAYKAVKYFVDNAEAVLLLTATPIQMGEEDLFTLLNLLRPDIIPDVYTFRQMAAPNPLINAAISEIRSQSPDWMKHAKISLHAAAQTLWGQAVYPQNSLYLKSMQALSKAELTDNERIELLTNVESLHTFSSILNRTRRRDIDSCYATRKSVTVETPFTKGQKEVYDKVLKIQSEILEKLQPETPAAFMISTLQRRAASCLPGLIPFLENILLRNIDKEEWREADVFDADEFDLQEIRADIEEVLRMARKLPPIDDKYDKLVEILHEKQEQENNKVMIFSTFRHTLGYLAAKLSENNFRVGVIHGGVSDENRVYLRDRFKLPKEQESALDILLFSEVGCEGLDYQFCDSMVNYDLPWNPMKIEQRIGRIDRTGQKNETVSIFNLITPDTVDSDIYHRCMLRIGIFERAIGGNEEILGEISDEIRSIGDNFTLTDAEKAERLEQLKDNKIREYQESEKLSEARADLFGFSLPDIQMSEELNAATSSWLSPESIENLIRIYLMKRLNTESDFILGSGSSKKLRLSQQHRMILLTDFSNLNPRPEHKKWKIWLEGKDREKSAYYSIYFDSKSSVGGIGDLITPTHPLVKQAIAYLQHTDDLFTSFSAIDSEVPEGEYPFVLYLWDYSGILKNQVIMPLAENDEISSRLLLYLKEGENCAEPASFPEGSLSVLEDKQYKLWTAECEKHKIASKEMLQNRIESLKQSRDGKVASIKEQIRTAHDPNILRMKTDELKNVIEKYEYMINELESSESTFDVESNLIGYGVVVIKHE